MWIDNKYLINIEIFLRKSKMLNNIWILNNLFIVILLLFTNRLHIRLKGLTFDY